MKSTPLAACFLLCTAMVGLSACAQSTLRINPDFGDAVREDTVAQIADPDAHYTGTPAPGASDGQRIGLAQTRYEKNQVVPPSSTTASSAGSIGYAENGNSAGMGAGAAAPAAASGP